MSEHEPIPDRKEEVAPDLFFSLDLRVGTVVQAEDFPEARKPSYRLRLDFGPLGVMNSSAQLTDRYSTDDLLGKQVIAAVNIGKRRIAGLTSECLVLGVDDEHGRVVCLRPDSSVANGRRVY